MRHFFRPHIHQPIRSCRITSFSTMPWDWQVLGIAVFLFMGLVSEGLACHTLHSVTPTSLTYYAVQSGTNPPNQTITFSRNTSGSETFTASDNAAWLTVSPATTSITTNAKLTAAVNTNGQGAGTYNATITIKTATWCVYKVTATLIISPATSSPPPTTSTATLRWNAVTGTPVSGYKVYVGEAPRLYSRTITVGNVTSSTVNNLAVGRTYYFVVTAYNGAGEGAPSNEVSKAIQ